MRRVRRLNPDTAPADHRAQGEPFAAYRYHAIFTGSPMSMLDAEAAHRDHAIIEHMSSSSTPSPTRRRPGSSLKSAEAVTVDGAAPSPTSPR